MGFQVKLEQNEASAIVVLLSVSIAAFATYAVGQLVSTLGQRRLSKHGIAHVDYLAVRPSLGALLDLPRLSHLRSVWGIYLLCAVTLLAVSVLTTTAPIGVKTSRCDSVYRTRHVNRGIYIWRGISLAGSTTFISVAAAQAVRYWKAGGPALFLTDQTSFDDSIVPTGKEAYPWTVAPSTAFREEELNWTVSGGRLEGLDPIRSTELENLLVRNSPGWRIDGQRHFATEFDDLKGTVLGGWRVVYKLVRGERSSKYYFALVDGGDVPLGANNSVVVRGRTRVWASSWESRLNSLSPPVVNVRDGWLAVEKLGVGPGTVAIDLAVSSVHLSNNIFNGEVRPVAGSVYSACSYVDTWVPTVLGLMTVVAVAVWLAAKLVETSCGKLASVFYSVRYYARHAAKSGDMLSGRCNVITRLEGEAVSWIEGTGEQTGHLRQGMSVPDTAVVPGKGLEIRGQSPAFHRPAAWPTAK
jgi:hypothetical protein